MQLSSQLLRVSNATVNRFGSDQPLINNLSFTVDSNNDSLLIIGGNGLGKSTFFRACSGLWPVTKGRIQTIDNVMFVQGKGF